MHFLNDKIICLFGSIFFHAGRPEEYEIYLFGLRERVYDMNVLIQDILLGGGNSIF